MTECNPKILRAKNYVYGVLNVHALPNKDYSKFPYCPDSILVSDAQIVFQKKNVTPQGIVFHDIALSCDAEKKCRVVDSFTSAVMQMPVTWSNFNMARQWLLANYVGK